jgi:hypothetical protein
VSEEPPELLKRHWLGLGAASVSGEHRVRVSELPVTTANGALAAAVDYEGNRRLLIPIDANQAVRRGLDGPILSLHKRPLEGTDIYQTYADLGCLESDFDDLFAKLCADALKEIETAPDNPLKALYRVLDRWKALFQARSALLGPEQLAGLFGELKVLDRLLEDDRSAHRLWAGPTGHHHDFSSRSLAVEVKSTTGAKNRRVRVHGLDQLDAPEGGELLLAWFQLEKTDAPDGESVADLVNRSVERCDDEGALLALLASAGYHVTDAATYTGVRFAVTDERWYRVDGAFPALTSRRLVAAKIPVLVEEVEYCIDLTREPPISGETDRVEHHLAEMIREEW